MSMRKIGWLYKQFVIDCFSRSSKEFKNDWKKADNPEFEEFKNSADKAITYTVEQINIAQVSKIHKWVGAQFHDGRITAIPNDATSVLCYDQKGSYISHIREGLFKWTGGCIWGGAVYCFPRTANSFLRISGNRAEEVPLTLKYEKEHHYSGVCTKDGVVYQPPRNTNHILKTVLNTGISKKINIVDDIFHVSFRYCGSIIHPNGYIYFFPERNNRVIKLDPKMDEWCFIGDRVSTMCFDAKVGLDGNIYGYSAYCEGVMKIYEIGRAHV